MADGEDGRSLAERLLDSERKEIMAAVEKSQAATSPRASRMLGINRSTLYYRLRKHGLEHLLPTKIAGRWRRGRRGYRLGDGRGRRAGPGVKG